MLLAQFAFSIRAILTLGFVPSLLRKLRFSEANGKELRLDSEGKRLETTSLDSIEKNFLSEIFDPV